MDPYTSEIHSPALRERGGIFELPEQVPLRLPVPELPVDPLPGRERAYVRPAYAEGFACAGPACEDSCCSGWSVPVDKATYAKYEVHESMQPFVNALVVLNTQAVSDADYARIPLSVHQSCPFLDEEKLCGIQKTLGEEMLSHTCATYPRAISSSAGQAETALNLSCPEATRLTLLHPHLLGDGAWQGSSLERYAELRHDLWRTPKDLQPRLVLREFVLLVLSDREYPLWQRMYLLGVAMGQMDRLRGSVSLGQWCDLHPASALNVIGDKARSIAHWHLQEKLDKLQAKPAQQLQLVAEMLGKLVGVAPMRQRFLECLQDFEAGIGCNTAGSEAEVLRRYQEGYERFYLPLMQNQPQMLENYLLNYIFKNNFPFGDRNSNGRSAHGEHLLLCAHAALVQTMLIGMAGQYRESFGESHVIKLVQSLSKAFEHSRATADVMYDFVKTQGLNSQQGIALLLAQREVEVQANDSIASREAGAMLSA